MKNMYYAGIGSRKTPPEILEAFKSIASYLALKGFVLRTGGASGADSAFEIGCNKNHGKKEIFLPWNGFNNNSAKMIPLSEEAMELAKFYHPNWIHLSEGARKMMARNCYQVLGANLKSPVGFILCYTPNGNGSGGTGQAIRIATDRHIPIIDAGKYYDANVFKRNVWRFLQENYNL